MFNCPCCIAFGDDCNGCPVAEAVDDVLCESTPYIAWSNYEHDALDSDEAVQNKLAEDELHFLVCLLPKGETAKMTDGTTWYWDWE
jgi:hypothetical protein